MKPLIIFKITIALCFFASCYPPSYIQQHLPKAGLITLSYAQSTCGNPWGSFSTDVVTVSNNMTTYFQSLRKGMQWYTLTLESSKEDTCISCKCKTGNLILIEVKNIDKMKQKFYSMGFKNYVGSYKFTHNN